MRTRIATLLAGSILLAGFINSVSGQHQHKHLPSDQGNTIVCYYTDEVNDRFIPPPEAYTNRLKSGEAGGARFDFIIENAPNLEEVEAACQKAGEIWGSLIYSPVPITIKLLFADQASGTLASTGTPWPPRLMDNNGNLPPRFYVQALAEKFYRLNLNGSNPDMSMTFNQNVSWYYGLDGNTPISRYDFLSTLLHEMAHGLGFFGYFHVDEDGFGVGLGIPNAFDGFIEDKNGNRLSDTVEFPQPSIKLGDALTSPPIYYNSQIVLKELPEETILPKMFIPDPWNRGSSLYHLDIIYNFKNAGIDALMTHSTDRGEAIHNPGPITTYMLYEIGWVHTYIDVDTLKDRESTGEPFTVVARIKGDQGIKANTQKLFYSFNGFQSVQTVNMFPSGNPDEFKADIPVPGTGTTVNYYIRTEDIYDRVYTAPAEAPKYFYRFHVGTDNTPPTIEHSPLKFMLVSNDSVQVKAEISDNLGLAETLVEYQLNGVDQPSFDLVHDTLADHIGYFVFGEGQIKADDVIKYRIKAVDASAAAHTTYDPATGYHEFRADDLPEFVTDYYNDFEEGLDDFGLDRFYHMKPDGWNSYGLHTDHPYPSPNRENAYDDLEAVLKIPIKLAADQMHMSFQEIAYIEDGEANSEFGDWNFWDYVIVEGSKDGGNTWIAFEDGWDCRYNSSWSDHFMAPEYQERNLSTAIPDQWKQRLHVIDMLAPEEFNPGDIILVRFRLYIDPFFAGWGWSIDNLRIGPTAGIKDFSILTDAVEVYPNPSTGQVMVNMQFKSEVKNLQVGFYNMVGQEVLRESFDSPARDFRQYFNLDQLPNGVYLIKLTSGNQSVMKKLILAR